jgi:hypothetical protein
VTPPPAGPFLVEWAGQARDDLRALIARAIARGIRHLFSGQVPAIQERLEHRPLDWGDPQKWLPALRLSMHQGMYEHLAVMYAVDEARRIVYVRGIRAVLNHPLAGG